MQNRIEFFFFQLLYRFVRLFSFITVQKMGKGFGSFIYSVIGLRKKLVLDNLQHAFPEKSKQEIDMIAKASYQNLFTAYFEIVYLDKITAEEFKQYVSFPDAQKIHQLLQRGKGLLILTGHYGNWELCALTVPIIVSEKYTVIVQKQRNPYINDFMTSMRSRFGSKLVVMERALRECLKALWNNEAVALISDQSGPESGVYANFFGRPASTHQGAAILQVRSGAPMIMVMLIREGDAQFRIELEEIDTENLSGTDEEKVQELTQRHVSMLEKYIRMYPEHWLWMHKRWKHTDSFLKRKSETKVSTS